MAQVKSYLGRPLSNVLFKACSLGTYRLDCRSIELGVVDAG